MPCETIKVPGGEELTLIYLRKWPNLGEMIYLQSVRSGRMKEDSLTATTYRNMAQIYAARLADLVKKTIPAFDAVVSPPSKRNDADVYRNRIVQSTGARDLSGGFARKGKISAATATSLQAVIGEFDYQPTGTEIGIKSLLISDESFASGRSVAAVLSHLRKAGLPKNAKVYVAVGAWLDGRPKQLVGGGGGT